MAVKLITAPSAEPVTLAEAKEHLRVTQPVEDALILRLIVAARRHAEQHTWRKWCTQTWEYYRDEFPCGVMELPYPPVQSVTSIKYLDPAGAEQTLSGALYKVSVADEPARIAPAYGQAWPSARLELNAITVRFVCGYGGAGQVPDDIKHAILLTIGHLFEHRESVSDFQVFEVPRGVDALLNVYRVMKF